MQQGIQRACSILLLLAVMAGLVAARAPRPSCIVCRAELHSWVVSRPFPGRHLFLTIDCPPGYEHLNGRVEYTSASLRWDFSPVDDPRFSPRVARMSRGGTLVPFFGDPNDTRLEAFYVLTLSQAECLQLDRMFSRRYELLGPNSTSGLLAVLRQCDCPVPDHIANGGGWLQTFPGAEQSPGAEFPEPSWTRYGVPGPTPIPVRPQTEQLRPTRHPIPARN